PGRHSPLDLRIHASHAFVNVVGFIPVGLVLWEFGLLPALAAAALMSGLAETGQMVMLYRDPSVTDFIANVMGAFLGAIVSAHWKIRPPALRINKWTTFIAGAVALALIAQVWAEKGPAISARGTTSPGTLEAQWKLDEGDGRVAFDSSGHSLNGRFSAASERVLGPMGTSVGLDGNKEYIGVGRSKALRLAGSITISAWINSSSFPYDDAAIVSQRHDGFGYQLDTTIDKGERTIGFKLSNVCGHLMARYGATPLVIGTWYHVTGVYDAPQRTLDVYLNGKLDNGPLTGLVTSTQHSSRWPVYIGRRSDSEGFGFAGLIRDVRIYSFALTNDEIAAIMRGESINSAAADRTASNTSKAGRATERNPQCTVISESGDQWIPAMAASLGVLVAIACMGLWPSASALLHIFSSLTAGLLLLPAIVPNVPSFNRWLIPLVTVAGGVSVVVSARRYPDSNRIEAPQAK
ncbi:MAG TPA: LamG domain-containing protein, partial [Candidatus Acidoferrum sp.]